MLGGAAVPTSTRQPRRPRAGSYAVNPASGERIPIWVADYVLGSYGSGAIMAVPGHDARDLEFAQAFGLPVQQVVAAAAAGGQAAQQQQQQQQQQEQQQPPAEAFTAPGVAVNSASVESGLDLNGLPTAAAKAAAIEWLESKGLGHRQVNYKLRDWLFARQRYWGEPFPIVYPEGSEVGDSGGSGHVWI